MVRRIIFVILFFGVYYFCHQQTDGFQVVKIISHLPPFPRWKTPLPTTEEVQTLQAVFSQPFYYLASGGQCYAFVSQDGRLVLKLFKMHNIRQYPFLERRSLPGILDLYRIKFLNVQKQKLDRVFSSSILAYEKLKDESGLLFLNLNPSDQFKDLKVTLYDKIGVQHHLDLAKIPFALQHKADPVFPTLRFHLMHKDISSCKRTIDAIVQCLMARYQKGVVDLDPAVRRNIGLLKDKAITIDIGSFKQTTELNILEELKIDTQRLKKWLLKHSPALAEYLEKSIHDKEENK